MKACIIDVRVFFFHAVDRTLFPHKEIVPRAARRTQTSTLAALLNEYDKRSANPFFEYSRFNGEVSASLKFNEVK